MRRYVDSRIATRENAFEMAPGPDAPLNALDHVPASRYFAIELRIVSFRILHWIVELDLKF